MNINDKIDAYLGKTVNEEILVAESIVSTSKDIQDMIKSNNYLIGRIESNIRLMNRSLSDLGGDRKALESRKLNTTDVTNRIKDLYDTINYGIAQIKRLETSNDDLKNDLSFTTRMESKFKSNK